MTDNDHERDDRTPRAAPRAPWWRPALYGWLGAASFGLVEVARVAVGRLHPGPVSLAALVVLSLAVTGGVGAFVAGAIGLVPPLRARRLWAFLTGVAAVGILELAVTWFSDPAPFEHGFSLQSSKLAFVLLGVVLPIVAVIGASLAAERRREVAPVVMGLLGLAAAAAIWTQRVPAPTVAASGGASSHPNLLLVTLDTTRADRFGSYPIDTSAFDRIASEGARFDLAEAQIPVTASSHATILLGRPPWEHGLLLNGRPLPTDDPTLAEILRGQGYDTGAFVSAYVLEGDLGYARGFDAYDDDFRWITGLGHILPGRVIDMRTRSISEEAALFQRRGGDTVDRALDWLDEPRDRPFFLWVHLFDAHGPYEPPPPYDERYYRGADPRDPANHSMDQVRNPPAYLADHLKGITDLDYVISQYDGEVAYDDDQLDRLLQWLDDHKQTDRTLVVVTGDHGEGLGEEGEWFAHGDWLYEHDLHVPMAMRMPGTIAPGRVVPTPVELTDLAPTILDYLGFPKEPTHSGLDERPAIDKGELVRATARAIGYDREANKASRAQDPTFQPKWRMASVRTADDKVVYRDAPGFPARFWVDGKEITPGTDQDQQLADVRLLLVDQAKSVLAGSSAGQGAVTDATKGMLQSLGYEEPDAPGTTSPGTTSPGTTSPGTTSPAPSPQPKSP